MMTALSFHLAPLLPLNIILPVALLALLTVLYAIIKGVSGGVWRLVVLSGLVLVLLNPSAVHEKRKPVKDVGLILVDDSQSQKIGQRPERTDSLVKRFEQQRGQLENLDLRIVRTNASQDRLSEKTELFNALNLALADVPAEQMAGVILITDGQIHDVPRDMDLLKRYGPIHTIVTGDREERDRRIEIVKAPHFGLVGKQVDITLRIEDNYVTTEPAVVVVRKDGAMVDKRMVPVGEDYPVVFDLSHGGKNVFEFAIEDLPGELTPANNKAVVVVNAVRDRLRVLLVSGEPHPGERTWRNLLKSDPSVDLVHFTILRPPEKQDATPSSELSLIAFPVHELFQVKLDEFDLIIFDRYRRRGVLLPIYFENIARYVEEGGALLEASGADFAEPDSLYHTALGRVLPGRPTGQIIAAGYRPALTADGQIHPVTASLPHAGYAEERWGRWFRHIDIEPRRGYVVMNGANGRPLLVLDRVGKGRVAQLSSDHIWLWSRGFEGGGPQAELLRRLAHWLMKEPELEENGLEAQVDVDEIIVRQRRIDQAPHSVTMTTPSGFVDAVEFTEGQQGWQIGRVKAEELGVYKFDDGDLTAFAVVGAFDSPELRVVNATADYLAPVAESSRGDVFWYDDVKDADLRHVRSQRRFQGYGWIGFRQNNAYEVKGLTDIPLLPAAMVLMFLLGGLIFTWRHEGQ